jgi:hypothetical protein
MPQFSLRTLLIILAIAPPVLAWLWYAIDSLPIALAIGLFAVMVFGIVMFWRSLTRETIN